jgi:hypothetical protein
MNKYILIQNDGEIESNSFELIGASTKRGQEGKIGFFGSGLKYSIAYMMRKEIGFRVFSGETELAFTTKQEKLKDQSFDRICINGSPTSYTTTMGPTWKEDWYVLREIYCNALDETNCQIIRDTEIVQPSEGKTRIYIQLTESLQSVIDKWDNYFSEDRTPIFTAENVYSSYLGNEDGTGGSRQAVSVYPKTEGILYRRGIRVYKSSEFMYDYGCSNVNINEDRTARNAHGINYAIADMMGVFADENWIRSILRTGQDDKRPREYEALQSNACESKYSDRWIDFSQQNMLVVRDISGRYAEEIQASKKEVFLLPSYFARELKKALPAVLITGMGNVIGDTFLTEIEATQKMLFLLKEVTKSLAEMNYHIQYDVTVVEFEDDAILGQADMAEKRILLASKTFDMGRREIAMTLMEENEHIKSGKGDETRAFQTHLFSQWLKTMEDNNGLFL